MNRFSLESPSAMRMVHCESTIWGAKEALYYSSLVSHSANDASLVMPIKSYCYELNLYDLSAEKQVCQLRQTRPSQLNLFSSFILASPVSAFS
jgi:hypothetical protein